MATGLSVGYIIRAGIASRKPGPGQSPLEHVSCYGHYCEPGYTDPCKDRCIVLGNWNESDGHVGRTAKILERAGHGLEWGDEWSDCSSCYGLVRTSPDSYWWTPSHWSAPDSGEILCADCVRADPADYLEYLSGNDRAALTMDGIDLSEHGYERRPDDYESGWHPGQDDSPGEIGEALREQGITDYIFRVEEKGQFYVRFSVWVKAEKEKEENSEN